MMSDRTWRGTPCTVGALCAALMAGLLALAPLEGRQAAAYRSPFDLAMTPDGKRLYVSDRTAGCVVIADPAKGAKLGEIALRGEPTGLALSPDGSRLYVAEYSAGTVAAVDCAKRRPVWRSSVGPRPVGLALAEGSGLLFVCNGDGDDVSVLRTDDGTEMKRIRLVREPQWAAVTPDGSQVVVANALPRGSANDADLAAVVSIVSVADLAVTGVVRLPPGSINLRQVRASPDGRWAYVVHNVARFHVPPTQIERGWINTNALSIVDLEVPELYATVLLDQPHEGAADPFGLALSPDGGVLWVSLGGLPEVVELDLSGLHPLLAGQVPDSLRDLPGADLGAQNLWAAIAEDATARAGLVNDLAALYQAGVLRRLRVGGSGLRGVCTAAEGDAVYVARYYSGDVVAVDGRAGREVARISLGAQPESDPVRQGEEVFHSATVCFQHWQSCASCHPSGRGDGLRWDLQNDGMGNPKKTRSLVKSHETSPVMALGVRDSAEQAVLAGFRFILFTEPAPEDVQAVLAYVESLQPTVSPHRARGGRPTPAARRGEALFQGPARCGECHRGPLLTDMASYDVGTLGELDRPGDEFRTPKLLELWRGAPYLHDGRAATLEEVLTTHNAAGKHGETAGLSREEMADLVAYLLAL